MNLAAGEAGMLDLGHVSGGSTRRSRRAGSLETALKVQRDPISPPLAMHILLIDCRGMRFTLEYLYVYGYQVEVAFSEVTTF